MTNVWGISSLLRKFAKYLLLKNFILMDLLVVEVTGHDMKRRTLL